jgi:hypothetical protein
LQEQQLEAGVRPTHDDRVSVECSPFCMVLKAIQMLVCVKLQQQSSLMASIFDYLCCLVVISLQVPDISSEPFHHKWAGSRAKFNIMHYFLNGNVVQLWLHIELLNTEPSIVLCVSFVAS